MVLLATQLLCMQYKTSCSEHSHFVTLQNFHVASIASLYANKHFLLPTETLCMSYKPSMLGTCFF